MQLISVLAIYVSFIAILMMGTLMFVSGNPFFLGPIFLMGMAGGNALNELVSDVSDR